VFFQKVHGENQPRREGGGEDKIRGGESRNKSSVNSVEACGNHVANPNKERGKKNVHVGWGPGEEHVG